MKVAVTVGMRGGRWWRGWDCVVREIAQLSGRWMGRAEKTSATALRWGTRR